MKKSAVQRKRDSFLLGQKSCLFFWFFMFGLHSVPSSALQSAQKQALAEGCALPAAVPVQ
jgi:hypothetical protein